MNQIPAAVKIINRKLMVARYGIAKQASMSSQINPTERDREGGAGKVAFLLMLTTQRASRVLDGLFTNFRG
jgi:hypothetical protein